MQTLQVPLDTIDISSFNTRKDMSAGGEDNSLDDLARSIAQQGLISPPVLRPLGNGRFEVIAGQRRILACQKAGLEYVPAIVRDDLSDNQALAVSLVENVQRADMSPLDKARAYEALRARYGNVAAVCRATGVSETTTRKYLSLLQLPTELQELVTTGGGPTGIGLMSQLATTFEDPEDMLAVWEKVKGFNSELAQKVVRKSGGDLTKLGALSDLALEGAFNVRLADPCGSSLGTCPFVPDQLRPKIDELVARAQAGEF